MAYARHSLTTILMLPMFALTLRAQFPTTLTAAGATVGATSVVLPPSFVAPPQPSGSTEVEHSFIRTPAGSQNGSTPPSSPPISLLAPDNAGSGLVAASSGFQVRSHELTKAETGSTFGPQTQTVGESSVASMGGNIVFYTANSFAALSTDGGTSFSYMDPASTFPNMNGGFCCDQVVKYARNQDMLLWSLLYLDDGTSNTVRLAVSVGATNVSARRWRYYDLKPQTFRMPAKTYLDFQTLTVGSKYLYVTSNVVPIGQDGVIGSVIFRIPLAQLAAGAGINIDYFPIFGYDTWRCTEGATTSMYCMTQFDFNQVLIMRFDDNSQSASGKTTQLNSFEYMGRGGGKAITPDGRNWAAVADSRILGAWVYGGVIGFMFAAQQDAQYPYPYLVVAQVDQSSFDLLAQGTIWNSNYGLLYPTVSVNAAGHLAGMFAYGGGTQYPNEAVWAADNSNPRLPLLFQAYTATSGNRGPDLERWGDYFSVQPHYSSPNTWVAGAYDLRNGGQDQNVVQRFLWFGKVADFPCVVTLDSIPAGRTLQFDGAIYTTPSNVEATCGTSHTISAPPTEPGTAGIRYLWTTWSDLGAATHAITASVGGATFTAHFSTQFLLSVIVPIPFVGPTGGTVQPSSGYYNPGQSVTISATPDPGFSFFGWSGNGTGSYTGSSRTATLIMSGPITEVATFRTSETNPPTNVSVIAPTPGQSISGTFVFKGSAQDDSGLIESIGFYVDGDTLPVCYDALSKPSGSVFQCSFDTSAKAAGPHTVVAKAFDFSSNVGSSPAISFSIVSGAPITATALRFVPITPCRLADTRSATGPFGGPQMAGGSTRDFVVPNGVCNVSSTAQAYSLNVAVVPAGPLGYLTVWPTGESMPITSNVNSLDGGVKSNAAIISAGTGGAISVFASNPTNVILDINGYFVPATDPTGLAFFPLPPCRVADTRAITAPLGGPALAGGAARSFPMPTSACGIPASASAYSLNLAAVPKGPLGYLTAWPSGQVQPPVASLNALSGSVTPNAAIVPAGAGGSIDVFASNSTDLVIDINGYFGPMKTGGLSLYNVTPCRALDTRQPSGTPPFSGSRDVVISGGACGIPAGAQAVVFGATVVPPAPLGYLTLWPQGQSQPTVATLNALDGAVTSNMAIVSSTNGSISAFASNPVHLVLDIFGYFAP